MHPRIETRHLNAEQLPGYLPEPSTEARLVEPVLAAINAAVQDCSVTAAQVIAGRMYERKGEQCLTMFGAPTNTAYDHGDGPFYLQLGVVVPRFAAKPVLDAIRHIEQLSDAERLELERAKLAEAQARFEMAQQEVAEIQASIDRLDPPD